MQIQLWLSPTPPGRGLVLLERLEGEGSVARPLTGASQWGKGNEKGNSPFFSPQLPTAPRTAGFWGLWRPQQGIVCSEENATSHLPTLGTMIYGFSLNYIEMGALPMGSGPLTLLSTPHHFAEPQDERNQQASGQCGSNFKAHSKTDRCVSQEVYMQG